MSHFFQKIKTAIDNQLPKELNISECELRKILRIHESDFEYAIHQEAINKAAHRIYGQLGDECSCLKVSILLYAEDIEALKILINNHCIMIAENYAEMEGIMAFFAEKEYEYCTNLMLKLK